MDDGKGSEDENVMMNIMYRPRGKKFLLEPKLKPASRKAIL